MFLEQERDPTNLTDEDERTEARSGTESSGQSSAGLSSARAHRQNQRYSIEKPTKKLPAPTPTPLSSKKRGRPRKIDQNADPAQDRSPSEFNMTTTPISGNKRGRQGKVVQSPDTAHDRPQDEITLSSTPVPGKKRGRPHKVGQSSDTLQERPQDDFTFNSTPLSGKKRGRSHKIVQSPDSTRERPQDDISLKSTPISSKKRGRPRKIVQSGDTPQDRPQDGFISQKISTEDILVDHDTKALNWSNDGHDAPENTEVLTPLKKPRKRTKAAKEARSQAQDGISISQISPDKDDPNYLENAASELRILIEEDIADSLMMLKTQILEGLTGQRRLSLVGLDQEYQKVHQIVEQTVLAGEGNSALIVGSRGTAKTTLVESVIADLASDHRDVFHVVRLNGFIHTDDKVALREIWRQLGREMEVEDDSMGAKSNYADTLMSLLALLAHPTEDTDASANQTAKSIVFILDEFDLFACHPRQTLLYNLFDVAQSRNAPIIVLGLTTKVDVVASLEKRVKSRFGQRYIHLSLSRSLFFFKSVCRSALIPQNSISPRLNPINSTFPKILTAWTTYVDALFEHDPIFNKFLQTLYYHSKSVPAFLASALLPVSYLSAAALPTGSSFISPALLPPDSKLHLLPSLSDSELALLIAAARLDIVLDSDTCTFSMAYDEYVQLASKVKIASSVAGQAAVSGGARVWGKEVAKEAWEGLADLELVVSVSGNRGGGLWRVDVALEEIEPSIPGLGSVMAKWCREI